MILKKIEVSSTLSAYVYDDLTLGQYEAWLFLYHVWARQGLSEGFGLEAGRILLSSRVAYADLIPAVVKWEGEQVDPDCWPELPALVTLNTPAIQARATWIAQTLTHVQAIELVKAIQGTREVDSELEGK